MALLGGVARIEVGTGALSDDDRGSAETGLVPGAGEVPLGKLLPAMLASMRLPLLLPTELPRPAAGGGVLSDGLRSSGVRAEVPVCV